MEVFIGIIAILVVAMLFTVSKTIDYYRQKKLFELVSWSIIGTRSSFSDACFGRHQRNYVNGLIGDIKDAQQSNLIDEKYRIIGDEDFEGIKNIIEEYQKDTARLYFQNQLDPPKNKYSVSKTDYFMMLLHDFLSKHSTEVEFFGHSMYSERKDYKSYGGDGYSATYVMSDFGILYYKLYYITLMYFKQKPEYKNVVSDRDEESTKDVLDKSEIEISCYRS